MFWADKKNEEHLVYVARECSVLGQFLKTTKTSPVCCRTSKCPCVCVCVCVRERERERERESVPSLWDLMLDGRGWS